MGGVNTHQMVVIKKAMVDVNKNMTLTDNEKVYIEQMFNCVFDLGRSEYRLMRAHRVPLLKLDKSGSIVGRFPSILHAAWDAELTIAAISRIVRRGGFTKQGFQYIHNIENESE